MVMRLVVLFAALALAACDPFDSVECTAIFVYGLNVEVLDADGSTLCGVEVVATDGAYREVLEERADGTLCTYVGAGERGGTYAMTAKKQGYRDGSLSGVVVEEDECHVRGERVELRLDLE